MIKPLQVYLDETDLKRLEQWASERGWSKSQAVRVALRALTHIPDKDPLLSASGMIYDLPEDLSEHFSRYLQETYIAENKPGYRKIRRRS
jgi:hypothetical protein